MRVCTLGRIRDPGWPEPDKRYEAVLAWSSPASAISTNRRSR